MSLVTAEQLADIVANCERITEPKSPDEWVALARKVHEQHIRWWRDTTTGEPIERDKDDLANLMVTELSEAFESYRRGGTMDDHLPHRCGIEVELADTMIRLLDARGAEPFSHFDMPETWDLGVNTLSRFIRKMTVLVSDNDWYDETIVLLSVGAKMFGIDLWGALSEKLAYNKVRLDHTDAERRKDGGKKL